ncbi:MAG: SDR family oxidoreductase [Gemmatimonadota bacterium]
MNLIVGATGLVGSAVCRLLRERDQPVRGLVRLTSNPARVKQLTDLGVQIVIGDLRSPASLRSACAGVSTVISTASMIASQQQDDSFSEVDDAGQRALIDAASSAGASHFIFVSLSGNVNVPCPLIDAKRAVERHLLESGLPFTILRPAPFMEFWFTQMAGFDHALHKANVLGDGRQEISYIALADVALFTAASVGNLRARNRTIELGGPEPISPLRAIALFEQVSGAPYDVQHVPREALEAQYDAAEHPTQKSFAGLMLALSRNDRIPMTATAADFGVKLTTVEDFAKRMIGLPAI